MIDENAPHHLRDHRQELSAILPPRVLLIGEAKIRLVYERRRLQRVPGAFAPELRGGTAAQLAIDECHRPIARLEIARGPGAQEARHVVIGIGHSALAAPILDR